MVVVAYDMDINDEEGAAEVNFAYYMNNKEDQVVFIVVFVVLFIVVIDILSLHNRKHC